MELKKQDLEVLAKNFFQDYKKEIGESLREDSNVVKVHFDSLAQFSPQISEKLLESPEEIIAILENAFDDFHH